MSSPLKNIKTEKPIKPIKPVSAKKVTKKKKKKKTNDTYKKIMDVLSLNNPTTRLVCGLFFAVLTVVTTISVFSYLVSWDVDQSTLHSENVLDIDSQVENQGGKIGFLWANFLVGKMFGLGALAAPFLFGGIAIACFNIKKINVIRLFFLTLSGAIVISMIFSYIFSFTQAQALFGSGAGGSYGSSMNKWMVSMFGSAGTAGVLLLLLAIWLLLVNSKIVGYINRFFDSLTKLDKKEVIEGDSENDASMGDSSEGGNSEEDDQEGEDDDESEDEDDEDDEDYEDDEDRNETVLKVDDVDLEIFYPESELRGEEADSDLISGTTPQLDLLDDNLEEASEKNQGGPLELEVLNRPEDDFSAGLTDDQWRHRYDPRLSLSNYKLPQLSLLEEYRELNSVVSRDELDKNTRNIVSTLKEYKINISKISARIGPTVTLYEIIPAPGVRVAQIKRLEEDIARSLAARGVRVVTLSGTNAVGIEVANERPSVVSMRSVLEDPKFTATKFDLPIALGKTISSEVMCFDLAKMPHLLVAGATGQGKSVGLNAIITSLLYKKHPSEMKFVLVDPKKVELSLYEPIANHYLAQLPDADEPIITDTQKVVYTLRSLCTLMDTRYTLLRSASVRSVKEYNEKFLSRKLNPHKGHEYMPYIVVIIDEFADLLMTAGREVEEPIARLAQLARAIGIHLVIATQRPTTNIITGTIKANFPARIAFRVISSIDSKTILDQTGANQLIGRGDMLISTGATDPERVQCAFIDTHEVNRLSEYIEGQQSFGSPYMLPEFDPSELGKSPFNTGSSSSSAQNGGADRDELFYEAAKLIVREQVGSTSAIQRKMGLGYNRAGRIMDQLEQAGIVGPPEGSKPRQVKVTSLELLDIMLSDSN